jgi:IS1 family transposase
LIECIFIQTIGGFLPKLYLLIGKILEKKHTIHIEHDNHNMRHHLARMSRCAKVVSKQEAMVHVFLISENLVTFN